MVIILITAILFADLLATRSGFSSPRVIPIEDFFSNPAITGFQLSPDGTQIASLQPYQQRLNIFIQDVTGGESRRITDVTTRDVHFYYWKNQQTMIYLQDVSGDENFHMYRVNIKTGETVDVTPFAGVRVGIIDALVNEENEILISMNKENPEIFDVYRLNLQTGKMTMEVKNPGNYTSYVTDHDGIVRIACGKDAENGNNIVYHRRNTEDPFQMIFFSDYRETLHPYFFTEDNKKLYGISNIGRDKKAVVLIDLEKDKKEQVIYVHPDVDIRGLAISEKRKVILGVSYVTDKVHICFLDKQERLLYERLMKKVGNYEITIVSEDRQEQRFILIAHNDRNRGIYYLYDAKTDTLKELARGSSSLQEAELALMKPIEYQARDGYTIHGYLTLPQGVTPQNLPLIVYPHGGPWSRDYWEYQPDIQFLANRGYAVLQMNFRGSTGYGKEFLNAGNKQWGKKMQDDITDGVNWAIMQGVADPKRVGIYGSSYGGYAALAGVTFTPELYACGIDLYGPSNLFTLLASLPPYWKPSIMEFYERIGHPEKDAAQLWEASPLFHADKITAPLLIGQGKNDPRVTRRESDQMVAALRDKGIEVSYMVKNNEGHGFSNEENRLEFYKEMEKFLQKYIKI